MNDCNFLFDSKKPLLLSPLLKKDAVLAAMESVGILYVLTLLEWNKPSQYTFIQPFLERWEEERGQVPGFDLPTDPTLP